MSFVHRFRAALNRHLHCHCCIFDGVFESIDEGGFQFRQASALTPTDLAAITEQVRRRALDADDARDMLAWTNGGFSLDASACGAGHDPAALVRLLANDVLLTRHSRNQ